MKVGSRTRSPLLAAAMIAGLASCGRGFSAKEPSRQSSSLGGEQQLVTIRPARILFLPQDSPSSTADVDVDGSRRFMVHGVRVLEHADGALEEADELFPAAPAVQARVLPERLGSGYLFYSVKDGRTLLWKSATWTGKLVPLANFDFSAEQVISGFDRLYIVPLSATRPVALDPSSGAVMDLGPLPPAPSYGAMGFWDAWVGAVEVPYRGLLASFDAGSSWHPVGVAKIQTMSVEPYGLLLSCGQDCFRTTSRTRDRSSEVVSAAETRFVIEPTGLFRPAGSEGTSNEALALKSRADDAADDEEGPAPPPPALAPAKTPGPLGRQPLRWATLHGWPDSPLTAVIARQGALGRVRLRDGRLVAFQRDAYSGGDCHALPVGNGFGFVCSDVGGDTSIYQFEPPLAMRLLMRFRGPRFIASSGNGALVIRGGCGEKTHPQAGDYCVRSMDGSLRTIAVKSSSGTERLVSLRDGRVAVLFPPSPETRGTLTLVEHNGKSRTVPLKLPNERGATILGRGLWLEGFTEDRNQQLQGWVVYNGPLVGIQVKLDGSVKMGTIREDIQHALPPAGSLALLLLADGTGLQTVDGGFTWSELDLPAELQQDVLLASREGGELGCSPVGCSFGTWLRLGWDATSQKSEEPLILPPKPTAVPSAGGGRWLINCEPTGRSSAPALAVSMPPRDPRALQRLRSAEELETTAWQPFFETRAPTLRTDEVGFDILSDGIWPLKGYVWGPRGANWAQMGKWQIYAIERFAFNQGVWTSAVSRSAWPDTASAARAFSHEGIAAATVWRVVMEPSGRGGALLIVAQGRTELFLFEEGHSVTSLGDISQRGIGTLVSALKANGGWYLGFSVQNDIFRVVSVSGTRLAELGDYPLPPRRVASSAQTRLVGTADGQGLALWASAVGWFLLPLDVKTGEVRTGIDLTPALLKSPPRPCQADESGWILTGQLPVEPYLNLPDSIDDLRLKSVEARLRVRVGGLCAEALAADFDSRVQEHLMTQSAALRSKARVTFPMVATERRPGGRRWEFRCAP